MSLFPEEPRKIRERIRRYERLLKKEIEEFGQISDGYGKRYLLGPLYLLLDDTAGALAHYEWFEGMFPGDLGHPMHTLCWSLALYRTGDLTAAEAKLRQLIGTNRYVLPCLLDGEMPDGNVALETYPGEFFRFEDVPAELYDLWDEAALSLARTIYESC